MARAMSKCLSPKRALRAIVSWTEAYDGSPESLEQAMAEINSLASAGLRCPAKKSKKRRKGK